VTCLSDQVDKFCLCDWRMSNCRHILSHFIYLMQV